jgi:hypothetical protein
MRNTYNNFRNAVDNSVTVYNDDDDNYVYKPNTTNSTYNTTTSTNAPNYATYEGDTSTYFSTYILDESSTTTNSGGDIGGGSSSSGSSGGGCNVSANASVGDVDNSISQGDININIDNGSSDNSSNVDNSTDEVDDVDINVSSFEKMIDQCSTYWDLVVNLINMLPSEISLSFASLLTVVVICRILGR